MPRVCRTCGRQLEEAAYCPFCSAPTIEQVPVHENQSAALTIRKLLNRKKKWIMIVCLSSCLLGIAGVLLAILLKVHPVYFMAPFFAVSGITLLYGRLSAFRCPECDNNFDLLAWRNSSWEIDQNIRYCPFCGVDLDIEIDPETHKPKQFLNKEWGQRGFEIKNTDIQLPPGKQKANSDIQLPPGKEEKGTPK